MKNIHVLLPDTAFEALAQRAKVHATSVEQYCSVLLCESSASSEEPKRAEVKERQQREFADDGRRTPQRELLKGIVECLRGNGGKMRKPDVEAALFQRYQDVFGSAYYQCEVGEGIPRWKKNVQFARNAGRDMGLIKRPEESGHGMWELTEMGFKWKE